MLVSKIALIKHIVRSVCKFRGDCPPTATHLLAPLTQYRTNIMKVYNCRFYGFEWCLWNDFEFVTAFCHLGKSYHTTINRGRWGRVQICMCIMSRKLTKSKSIESNSCEWAVHLKCSSIQHKYFALEKTANMTAKHDLHRFLLYFFPLIL